MQNTPVSEKQNKHIPLSTEALYALAGQRNIPIYGFPLERVPSMSIMDAKGACAIALKKELAGKEEHVCLAHEMGHCVTGTFYRITTSGAVRGKSEYKADKWAIYHLIPPVALEQAIHCGISTPWHLAEHFDVTEEFMLKALDFYACVRPMT